MTDKHSNNFAQSPHYHGDWHGNRFDDIMYTEQQTAELRGEIAEQSEWLKDNADICLADKAEQAMSRSEARAWKYEQEQSYRK
jgi:hypothetical protein